LGRTLSKKFYYGGQAVIEGVMMRGRRSVAVAVRRPNGEITVRQDPLGSLSASRFREIPFLRGIVILAETLIIGVRALFYSASVAVEEEDEQEISSAVLWGSMAVGVILALVLFLAIPLLIIHYLVDPHVSSPVVGNVVDGVIRLIIFLIYLKAISMMTEIRKVFAYHGAEHATINAYEAGEVLEVDRVRDYGTAHSRCGTSFLLFVLVIAIIAHAFLGDPPLLLRFLERLAILPAIAAVSYELIRFSAGHVSNRIVSVMLAPGLALQSMTTRKPDDRQIEVAISALKRVIADDVESSAEPAVETAPVSGVTDGAGGVHP
jgi:uncharacterized protein YqhQ